jgi:hypothetical protein
LSVGLERKVGNSGEVQEEDEGCHHADGHEGVEKKPELSAMSGKVDVWGLHRE